MNKFIDLITTRQSDRKYNTEKPVELEDIYKCIEAARLAPSACNAQPWKFVVVTDSELKLKVGECASSLGMNKFCPTAPVILAVVLEKPNFMSKIGSVIKDKEFMLLDIGLAVGQFCLQATELGLGTCMVGWFDEKKVKNLLSIPSSKRIPLLITLGYPTGEIRSKIRKGIEDISTFNKY